MPYVLQRAPPGWTSQVDETAATASNRAAVENRLCGGASVQVDLVWSGTANRFAIGASLRLDTDAGGYRRDVQATSGYLSSNPPRVHFGFPAGERPRRLTIRWPDGSEDVVDAAHGLTADTLLTVTRQHPPAP